MAVKRITKRWLYNSFLVILVVLSAMIIGFSVFIRSYFYNNVLQIIKSNATVANTLLVNYSEDNSVDFSSAVRAMVEDFEMKDQMELMALDRNGNIIITSSGFSPDDTPMPDFQEAMESSTQDGVYQGPLNNEPVMAYTIATPVVADSELAALRYVVSLSEINRQIIGFIALAGLIGMAIIFFVILSSSYFINSIVNPVDQVGKTARRIAHGDFSVRLQKQYDDEVGELCDVINYMAEELKENEKMKNDFISSVSHELRTPLTAIKGWAETLKDPSIDYATLQKGMGVILKESDRLSSMVEELLDFSRMQSGRLVMEKERLDAVAELSDAVLIFTERARQENKALEYQEPEFFAPVLGDHNRLRQVFINILDNALKYSDSGDAITVLPRLAEGAFLVTVSDTGCGISEEDLPMVKTRFYKGHTTRRGSGIGLAVADEIIRMHGGTLTLDSVKDKGTTVSITLPLEAPQG